MSDDIVVNVLDCQPKFSCWGSNPRHWQRDCFKIADVQPWWGRGPAIRDPSSNRNRNLQNF